MNWLLVALVAGVALGAPKHPDHFTMRIAPENPTNAYGTFDRRDQAACVHAQVTKQLPATTCDGSVTA